MEKVYIIKTVHGYEYLLNLGITKKAFKSKDRCMDIISGIAEEKYGKPKYAESSQYVKIVRQYWAGDFSMEEALEKMGPKVDSSTVFMSALYYDFLAMFWIEELEIEE